jgi:hypothetical protein
MSKNNTACQLILDLFSQLLYKGHARYFKTWSGVMKTSNVMWKSKLFVFVLSVLVVFCALPVKSAHGQDEAAMAMLRDGLDGQRDTTARQLNRIAEALENLANGKTFSGKEMEAQRLIEETGRLGARIVERAIQKAGPEVKSMHVVPVPEYLVTDGGHAKQYERNTVSTQLESSRTAAAALTRGLRILESIASGQTPAGRLQQSQALKAFARAIELMGGTNELKAGSLRVSAEVSQGLLQMLARRSSIRNHRTHQLLGLVVSHGRTSEIKFLMQGIERALAEPFRDSVEVEMPIRKGTLGGTKSVRISLTAGGLERLLLNATSRIYELQNRIAVLEGMKTGAADGTRKRQITREIKVVRASQTALTEGIERAIRAEAFNRSLDANTQNFLALSAETRATTERGKGKMPVSVEIHAQNMKARFASNVSQIPGFGSKTPDAIMEEIVRPRLRIVR